ncbi:MAG: hypothetical protein NTX53_18775 [candidate division WOR-3 bacterium]|nr:hypothetical protein [candidate division WOR-3 bacterium]
MIRTCSTALLLLALLPVIAFGQSQQVIHLKDGSTVNGEVINQDEIKLLVRTEYGTLEIPKANVLKMDFGETPKPESVQTQTQTQPAPTSPQQLPPRDTTNQGNVLESIRSLLLVHYATPDIMTSTPGRRLLGGCLGGLVLVVPAALLGVSAGLTGPLLGGCIGGATGAGSYIGAYLARGRINWNKAGLPDFAALTMKAFADRARLQLGDRLLITTKDSSLTDDHRTGGSDNSSGTVPGGADATMEFRVPYLGLADQIGFACQVRASVKNRQGLEVWRDSFEYASNTAGRVHTPGEFEADGCKLLAGEMDFAAHTAAGALVERLRTRR